MSRRPKAIPKLRSEAERVRSYKLRPSTTAISLRLPVALLDRIKVAANKRGVPYQSLIKSWLADRAEIGPSREYRLFVEAIRERKQITCTYAGKYREVCPIILGHREGEERALVYQFGGRSSGRLPSAGAWRCFTLSEISNAELRDGPWHSGSAHSQPQGCVVDVDLDVNPDSPYTPRRSSARKGKGLSRR